MRILFHASNRRGLGHVVRAATLIQAIQVRAAHARCLLAVSHALPAGLLPPGVRSVTVGSSSSGGVAPVLERVRGLEADLVVFDTVVPEFWRELCEAAGRKGTRIALVLRELRPLALSALCAHPVLPHLSAILIPHRCEEWNPELDLALTEVTHVGLVARLDPGNVRPHVGTNGDAGIDILSTAGGGGHRELCEPFVAMVIAADRELRRRGLAPRHLLVTGPRYSGAVPEPGEIEVRGFEPRLPRLISCARVVVARAGYNTVAEIEAAGTPAILVPADPGLDDQHRRAHRLAAAGVADVIESGDVSGLTHLLERRLSGSGPNLRSAPPTAGADGFTPGTALAAAHLLALAGVEAAHV